MLIVTLDMEGVLVPEIWISVAERTGIEELRLTTRDVADYDDLMAHRLRLLDQHGLKLSDIQRVIATLEPLPGAKDFLDWLRRTHRALILSDTFEQFAEPLIRQLDWPTLFCHSLVVQDDHVVGYQLRLQDQKRAAVRAMHDLNFTVVAAGDSFNDISMLLEADQGILFRPPAGLPEQYPQLPVATSFDRMREIIETVASSPKGRQSQ